MHSVDDIILDQHVQIARWLAEMFGNLVETVVHDYRNPHHSIIAIFNNRITHRKIGDPTSDLGFLRIKKKLPDSMVNYSNKSPSGKKLRSSVLAIRNPEGALLGVVAIHFDISYFDEMSRFIDAFISTKTSEYLDVQENFHHVQSSDEIQYVLQKLLMKHQWQSRRLNSHEKTLLIRELSQHGVFNKRGAVATLAKELNMSRQGIYKHLRQIMPKKER